MPDTPEMRALKLLLREVAWAVPSPPAMANACLEHWAIRAAFEDACRVAGVTEDQVRESAKDQWKRGARARALLKEKP